MGSVVQGASSSDLAASASAAAHTRINPGMVRVWSLSLAILLALFLGLIAAEPASAQTRLYWAGPGGNCSDPNSKTAGDWDTTSLNWCTTNYAGGSKVAWTNGSIADFGGNQAPTITVTESVSASEIFNYANYLTINGAGNLTIMTGRLDNGSSCAFGYYLRAPLSLPATGLYVDGGGADPNSSYLNLGGVQSFQSNISGPCDVRVIANGVLGSAGVEDEGNYTGTIEVRQSGYNAVFGGNQSQVQTVSGGIVGAGGLFVHTSHRVILTGTNTYGGPTRVANSARLQVDSSTPASSAVTVEGSAARLGGHGSVLGSVTYTTTSGYLTPGSVLSELYTPTTAGDVGELSTGALSLGSSTSLFFDLGQANTAGGTYNDLAQVNGDLTLDGRIVIKKTTGGSLSPGVYRLFNYTGTLTDNGLTFTGGSVAGMFQGHDVYQFNDYSTSPVSGPYYGYIDTATTGQVNLVVVKPITGTVFEDITADLLADGSVGGVSNPGIEGITVRLFDGASVVATTTTGPDGGFTLFGEAGNTYHVQADMPRVTAAGDSAFGEQTYASAGNGNSGAAGGSGYGVLCVSGTPPTYVDSGATVTTASSINPANGVCYGGRRGTGSDNSGTTLDNNEHVTRVVVGQDEITGVDFGFSFNVVTKADFYVGQGTLRRFIANANAIPGGNEMRFVPAMAANQTSGSDSWWRISPVLSLYVINDASTVIDGTAYSREDGTTVLDFNNAALGTGGTVGRNAVSLAQLDGPELEIKIGGGTSFDVGLDVQAANSEVRNIAVSGFGPDTMAGGTTEAQIRVANASGVVIENTLLGSAAANSLVEPTGAETNTTYGIVSVSNAPGTVLRNNLIGFPSGLGIFLDASANVTIEGNEVVGASYQSPGLDGMSTRGDIGGLMFRANRVADNQGTGIEIWSSSGDVTIVDNTSIGNGAAHSTTNTNDGGILVGNSTGTSYRLVKDNILTGNSGAGINVYTTANDTRVHITQNQFFNNGRNAIDLNIDDVTIATATGANCPSSGTANGGIPRPQITNATVSGSTLTVSGTYCNTGTYTLEFYKAAVGSGDTGSDGQAAGEGFEYIGSLTGLTGGTFADRTLTVPGTVSLANGDSITAIAIREDGATTMGNTSEFSANATAAEAAVDYGDAPASYPTLQAENGASHETGSGLFLGTLEGDPEDDGQPNAAADGDDVNDTSGTAAGDDEDGVTLPTEFLAGTSADITVIASQTGSLNAWIDWNNDGDWLDTGEQVASDLALAAGSNTVTITVPDEVASAETFARFRLDSGGGLSPTGQASDGEVEDYQVTVSERIDFGDAPDSYLTTEASDGARHVIPASPSLYIGQTPPDTDDGTLASAGATGDDQDGTSDEDGITLPNSFVPGESAEISIWVSGSGLLNGWIDWDGSGTFEAGEQIATEMAAAGGAVVLNVPVPAGAIPGTTYIRFRVCSASGECSATNGLASDGEVEDYAIVIGDTISVSGTVFEDNGAGGGTAHDGTRDTDEAALAGITVEARDNATDALLATAVTDGDGHYSLVLPGSATGTPVRIAPVPPASLLAISENPGTPNGLVNPSTTDGRIVFIPQAGTPVADVDFGYVQVPTLTLDRTLTMGPGNVVLVAHTYKSFTSGAVTFTMQNAVLNPSSAFAGTLYLDGDCSATLDDGEAALSGPVSVSGGDTVCLLVRVQTSSGAPAGSAMAYDIFANLALSGSTATHQALNHDQITVTDGVTLELIKRVRNITEGTGFGTSNAAGPGNVLEYQIIFTNPASEIARNVTIHDQTPTWTTLEVGAGATVAVTPPGMSCSVVTPSGGGTDGYTGQLQWTCMGDLAPGGQGEVRFQVQIDQ